MAMQQEIMLGVPTTRLRLDPRTKMLLAISVNAVLISAGIVGSDMILRLILAMIPAVLLLSEGKIRVGILYILAFSVSSFCEMFVIQQTSGTINVIILVCSGLLSRFLPGIITGYYLVTTTTVSEFIATMEQMHITNKITIPMSVMFRFLPTIAEEMSSITTAMKMRGIGKGGRIKNPLTILEYKYVPLMMSVVKIGEELSAASLTKGLGSDRKRTNICQIGFRFLDVLLGGIALCGLLGSILF